MQIKARIVASLKCKSCHKDFDITLSPLLQELAMQSLMASDKSNTMQDPSVVIRCPDTKCHFANGLNFMLLELPFKSMSEISISFMSIEKHLQTELAKKLKEHGFKYMETKDQ